jgi:hypothetical protein
LLRLGHRRRALKAGRWLGFDAVDGSPKLMKEALAGDPCAALSRSGINVSINPLQCGP